MEALTPPCVVSKTPSEYYLSCIEDNILLVSNSDTEVEMNSKFPKFEIMCRMLSEELLAKQRIDFDEFKTSSPEQRYLNLLQKRPDLVQRVPQHQLASYLGIKPHWKSTTTWWKMPSDRWHRKEKTNCSLVQMRVRSGRPSSTP